MKPLNILELVIKKLFEGALEWLRVSARAISGHKSSAVCSFAIQWEWQEHVYLYHGPISGNAHTPKW